MKKITQFLSLFGLLVLLSSNVSQPGVYNSGGMAFSMLFPEDSLAYKKVQMQQEKIVVQLYKGYAVVKGSYKMVNTTNQKLSFKMGYPINGIYNGGGGEQNQVLLDSIYKFKILSNNTQLAISANKEEDTEAVMAFKSKNWLCWQIDFLPNQTNNVVVYFIVNTNNAKVTKGYNKKESNSFIYLLESGRVWQQPIQKGVFAIELKDNLEMDAIDGLSDHFDFKKHPSQNILFGQKNNFSPTVADNLVVTYSKTLENFDFNLVLKNEKQLFEAIDAFSNLKIPTKLDVYEAKNPYHVPATLLSYLPMILMTVVIYGPILLLVLLVGFGLRFVYRKFKK